MDRLSLYLKPVPRHAWAWWLVAGALFAGSICGGMETYRLHQLAQLQQARLEVLQSARRVAPPPKPTRAELEAERHWIALEQEREFSWYQLFAALENTTNPDVALLEFLPDKTAKTLTLRGSARDVDALTAYLEALAKEPAFREVYLAHQKKTSSGAMVVVGFEIRMQLR